MADPRPRLQTRDLLGPVAVFLGALLLAVAFAVGPLLGESLRKVPMDIDQTMVADGADGAELLNRCSLDRPRAEVVGGQVQQRRRVVTVRPANSDVVTLQAGTALGVDSYLIDGRSVKPEQACAEPTLAATLDRVTLDRRTAEPTGESEVQFDDERAASVITDREGFTYLLPFGFDRDGLRYYDVTTRQSLPMAADGTETMDGRELVRFVVDVPETDLSQVQDDPRTVLVKPASWFGEFAGVTPDQELTAALHHRAQRVLFVDAATGVLVSERAEITEVFRFTGDALRQPVLADFTLTSLQTTLSSDRQTITEAADYAAGRAWPVTVATRVVPIVAGVLGVLLLAAGIWQLRRQSAADQNRRAADEDADDTVD